MKFVGLCILYIAMTALAFAILRFVDTVGHKTACAELVPGRVYFLKGENSYTRRDNVKVIGVDERMVSFYQVNGSGGAGPVDTCDCTVFRGIYK